MGFRLCDGVTRSGAQTKASAVPNAVRAIARRCSWLVEIATTGVNTAPGGNCESDRAIETQLFTSGRAEGMAPRRTVRPAMAFPMCNGEPEMLPNGVKEASRVSACPALFDQGAMVAGRQNKEQGTVSRSSVGYDIAGTGDLGLLVRHRNTGRVEAAW